MRWPRPGFPEPLGGDAGTDDRAVQQVVQLTASGTDVLTDRGQPGRLCRSLPHSDLGVECKARLDDPEQQEQQDRQS